MPKEAYSTAEIIQMLGVSKSTLFRWERDGLLPPIPRDATGQRQYGQEHIIEINRRRREHMQREYNRASQSDDTNGMGRVGKALSLQKFLDGDLTGLSELAEAESLSADTIRQLVLALERYEPGTRTFCEIIRVLWEQSKSLCEAKDGL